LIGRDERSRPWHGHVRFVRRSRTAPELIQQAHQRRSIESSGRTAAETPHGLRDGVKPAVQLRPLTASLFLDGLIMSERLEGSDESSEMGEITEPIDQTSLIDTQQVSLDVQRAHRDDHVVLT